MFVQCLSRNPIEEYLDGLIDKTFVYGALVDDPLLMETSDGSRYYYLKDRRYNVKAMTDQNAGVIERYDYSAFGLMTITDENGVERESSIIGNPYGFTGRRWDSLTGLWYYRNRTYSSELGRFLQRDPAGYADSMCLYSYVKNNPLIFVDPSGMLSMNPLTDMGMKDAYGFKNSIAAPVYNDFSYSYKNDYERNNNSAFNLSLEYERVTMHNNSSESSNGGFLDNFTDFGNDFSDAVLDFDVDDFTKFDFDSTEVIVRSSLQYGYELNDPVNLIDPYGLYSFDTFIQDAANYSAGFGDTLTSGFGLFDTSLTQMARESLGSDGVVDKCSGGYTAGKWSGYAWGVATAGSVAASTLNKGIVINGTRVLQKVPDIAEKQLEL